MKRVLTHLVLVIVVSFAGFSAAAGDCAVCPTGENVMTSVSSAPVPCHAPSARAATTRIGAPCCCRISSLPESDAAGVFMPAPVFSVFSPEPVIVSARLPLTTNAPCPRDSYFLIQGRHGPQAKHNDVLALRMTFVI